MRIAVLTVNHNRHAPVLLERLCRRLPHDEILVCLSTRREQTGIVPLIRRYGIRYATLKAHEMLVYRARVLRGRFRGSAAEGPGALRAMPEVLAAHGVSHFRSGDVNAAAALCALEDFAPELMISLYFDQILGAGVMGLCADACVNLHPSLLPAHAGSSPVFWTLAEGDRTAGITMHRIAPRVDAGEILYQQAIPVTETDTVFSLYRRCTEAFAEPLVSFIESRRAGAPFSPVVYRPARPASYHGRVTSRALDDFLERGRRFI